MEKATLNRVAELDNLLLFAAHYRRFRFDRHSHDEFALGLMHRGVQRFHCRGEMRYAPAGSLISVNPGEIHDGMSGTDGDFSYRIIYIPHQLMQEIGTEMVRDRKAHFFDRPVIHDPELSARMGGLFTLLDQSGGDLLETQTILYQLLAAVLTRYGSQERCDAIRDAAVPLPVRRACCYIRDNARAAISLDDIADAAGLSRFHFLRLFSETMAISPYAFLLQQRLALARVAIRSGSPLADAAIRSGFADQSHMSRRFKAAFGITPGKYLKAVRQ